MNKHNYSVVIIDDDKVDRINIKRLLHKCVYCDFRINEAEKAEQGLELCLAETPDCIVIDYVLPRINGLEFIVKLKQRYKTCLPAIIMLTGQGSEETAVMALQSGAQDYLNKNVMTASSLEKSILSSIQRRHLENQLIEKDNALKELAMYDTLTHLYNRHAFLTQLKSFVSAAQRYSRLSALLFIDLDEFKRVNDTLGHDAGDQLLKAVADRITGIIRDSDVASRVGGDEFAVILNEIVGEEFAGAVAMKLCGQLSQPFFIGHDEVKIGASIGIVCFPDDTSQINELVKRADIAMYRAKALGKNTYQFYCQELYEQHQYKMMLNHHIKQSLKNNEMSLVYQPIVDLRNEEIIGFEVLARWYCRKLQRQVSPQEFVAIAEMNHFIDELSEWILQTACQQLHEWQRDYEFAGFLSINLSNRQLLNADFILQSRNTLRKHEIAKSSIHFEMTENCLMRDITISKKNLSILSDIGVKIHVDDFGTGSSSLHQLRTLPIYILKIDQSFVQDIGNSEGEAIINAIIAMSHALHYDVVAEGIESEKQKDFLVAAGCYVGQGFYFYTPQRADEISLMLNKTKC